MRKVLAIALCLSMIVSSSAIACAQTNTAGLQSGDERQIAAVDYQVVDGQAFKMCLTKGNAEQNSGTVEMQGYYRSTANYDESEIVVNGNTVLTFSEENSESAIQPRTGYTRQDKPAFGTAKDYTVSQGTTKRNVTTNAIIMNMAVATLFAFISPVISAAYSYVAQAIINAAIAAGTKTKTAYYTETKKGHKTIPGLYHQYTVKWYLDSGYKTHVANGDSVCYDYWS